MNGWMVFAIISLGLALALFAHGRYHQEKVKAETQRTPPPGKSIAIDGTTVHVFGEGTGSPALVFLSGHGTTCPVIDFKPLWVPLAAGYRILVVERPGYGWSEGTKFPRDLKRMFFETQSALEGLGEGGPFVVLAHSMAWMEAFYWAKHQAKNLRGIVAIDPLTPSAFHRMPPVSMGLLKGVAFLVKMGAFRWIPEEGLEKALPILQNNTLTEEDKRAARALFLRRSYSPEMLAEVEALPKNVAVLEKEMSSAQVPMLLFLSSEQEERVPGWKEAVVADCQSFKDLQVIGLEGGHYLHHEKGPEMVEVIEEWLRKP